MVSGNHWVRGRSAAVRHAVPVRCRLRCRQSARPRVGVEVGLTVDVVRAGLTVLEVLRIAPSASPARTGAATAPSQAVSRRPFVRCGPRPLAAHRRSRRSRLLSESVMRKARGATGCSSVLRGPDPVIVALSGPNAAKPDLRPVGRPTACCPSPSRRRSSPTALGPYAVAAVAIALALWRPVPAFGRRTPWVLGGLGLLCPSWRHRSGPLITVNYALRPGSSGPR